MKVHFEVQLKQEVRDELRKGFEDHPDLNTIHVSTFGVSNFYTKNMLLADKFVVEYDTGTFDYKVIEPEHLYSCRLSALHIKSYISKFNLDDDIFEWE